MLNYRLLTVTQKKKWIWLSISSAPCEDHLLFLVRDGISAYKRKIKEYEEDADPNTGIEVEICDAKGIFVLPSSTDKEIVFLTNGVGIAAVRGLVVQSLYENSPQKMILFYSNFAPETSSFLTELNELQNDKFTMIPTMTGMDSSESKWTGEDGRITLDMIQRHIKNLNDKLFYVVGSQQFVDDMVDMLKEQGIERRDIVLEKFTGL